MIRRIAALLLLAWSSFCWVFGLFSLANGSIGLMTGEGQWVQIGTTTMFGLGPVFGVGAICIALGYGLGRAGLLFWRNPRAPAATTLDGVQLAMPQTFTLGMANNSRTWFAVRLLFVAFWLLAGINGGLPEEPQFASMGPAPLLFGALVGLLGTRFWVFREYKRSGRKEPWLLPSWSLNPFQIRQPFQFFHLAGVSFVVFGLAALLRHLGTGGSPSTLLPELFAAAFGAGVLAGILLTTMAHKDRFVSEGEGDA